MRVYKPAFLGLLLTTPFVMLEVLSTGNLGAVLNIPLWGALWVLATLFMLMLTSLVQSPRPRNPTLANRTWLGFRVAALIPLAWLWAAIVIDQMPCFLGVPNCD